MHCRARTIALALACTAALAACTSEPNRDAANTTAGATADEAAREAERLAEAQRARDKDVAELDEEFLALQRDFDEKVAGRPRGTAGSAAAGRMNRDLNDDMTDVREAVNELKTTTADNWWERHERAITRVADNIDADVQGMTSRRASPRTPVDRTLDTADSAVSAAPFRSRRDRLVTDLQARINAWRVALGNVTARGSRAAELDDLKARIDTLSDDVGRLQSAEADEWWDLSKTRVNEAIERTAKSIERFDDNRR